MYDYLEKLSHDELINIIKEKNDYLSLMVHQLRTPLTAEKWFLEMLCSGNLGVTIPSNSKENIFRAQTNIDSALTLLREISQVTHSDEWKLRFSPTVVSLTTILEKVVHNFTSEAMMKHISLIFDQGKDILDTVCVDIDKINIVFQNILENAIKYSPVGSTIQVQIHLLAESVVVSISDQGIGIPYNDQKHICEKLYRASNTTGTTGTGLGMYIAKQICEHHQGSLWFESIPEVGTTFFVKIPQQKL